MQEEIATLQKVYDVLVEFVIKYSFQIVGALIILSIGVKGGLGVALSGSVRNVDWI